MLEGVEVYGGRGRGMWEGWRCMVGGVEECVGGKEVCVGGMKVCGRGRGVLWEG